MHSNFDSLVCSNQLAFSLSGRIMILTCWCHAFTVPCSPLKQSTCWCFKCSCQPQCFGGVVYFASISLRQVYELLPRPPTTSLHAAIPASDHHRNVTEHTLVFAWWRHNVIFSRLKLLRSVAELPEGSGWSRLPEKKFILNGQNSNYRPRWGYHINKKHHQIRVKLGVNVCI